MSAICSKCGYELDADMACANCDMASMVAEAVAAERERCARLAESYGGSKFEYSCVGREIAREIRKGENP